MRNNPLLVGLDVGTTNIKALVFSPSGAVVAQSSIRTPTHSPQPGWAYYEPEELWQSVVHVLSQVSEKIETGHIAGIAIASMGEAGVALDAHNQPLYPIIAWFDPRTKAQAQWLADTIGNDILFDITGLSLQPIFGLCKLLWLKQNEPHIFEKTGRWLNVSDYIAFRLCGQQATDFSLASRTLALNIHEQKWASDILQEVGISPSLYAPLCASGTNLGTLIPEVAQQIRFPNSTVVAAGGHDHVCGAFAVGVTQSGMVLDSMGTSETVFLTLDQPLTAPEIGHQGFTQGIHVVPDKNYIFGALYSSGGSVEWFRNHFSDFPSYQTLIEEAENIHPGSNGACFLPHLQLASPPYDDPKGRGAFIGLGVETERGVLFRSVLEGIAYDSRQMLEAMLYHNSVPDLNAIRAFGGGTRNPLLMRIKATVMDQPIEVTEVSEATSLGAALLAGIGAGVYTDMSHALATLEIPVETIEPIPEAATLYQQIYENVYQQLYTALKPLHQSLVSITEDDNYAVNK